MQSGGRASFVPPRCTHTPITTQMIVVVMVEGASRRWWYAKEAFNVANTGPWYLFQRCNPPFRMLNRCAACVIKGDYHTGERWRARGPTVFRNRYPRYTRPRLLLITIPTWLFYNLVREIAHSSSFFFFLSYFRSYIAFNISRDHDENGLGPRNAA